jgi:hypothetical protein
MAVHHGRHEMPGWRGYLPESVDRPARGASGRRGDPRSRRVVIGAVAVCALAGGAVAVHARSTGPAAPSLGPVDGSASVLARSSAWTREATPVLAAIELESRRTDDTRLRWDASSVARRGGPPPRAVVALLERGARLAHHREALRAAMLEVRLAPTSESALRSASQELSAAQEMLRALVAGRSAFGDPVEATVMRLLDQGAAVSTADPRRGSRSAGPGGRTEDTVIDEPLAPDATVRLTAATSVDVDGAEDGTAPVSAARERAAPVPSSTRRASGAEDPGTAGAGAPRSSPTAASGADRERVGGGSVPQRSASSGLTGDSTIPSDVGSSGPPAAGDEAGSPGTMLTFDHRWPDESVTEPSTEPRTEPTSDEETSAPDGPDADRCPPPDGAHR